MEFVYSRTGPEPAKVLPFSEFLAKLREQEQASSLSSVVAMVDDPLDPLPDWALRIADNHLIPKKLYYIDDGVQMVADKYFPPQFLFHGVQFSH